MPTQTQKWISLREVMASYADRAEINLATKEMKLWNIAYDGMTQCGLDAFYAIKSILLPVNSNLTASFPADYLQYLKIGVLNGVGEVQTIRRNPNISKLKSQLSNRIEANEGVDVLNYNTDSYDYYNYWACGGFCNIYGAGIYNASGFDIDEKNALILLNGYNPQNLVLEYLASPDPEEDYKVPIQFKEALIAFIGWKEMQFIPNSRRGTIGDKQLRERNFYNERRLAKARFEPFRLNEVETRRVIIAV